MSWWNVLLAAALAMLLLLPDASAVTPSSGKFRRDFKVPGGAKAALGEAKLTRLIQNSSPGRTVDELAKLLEDDDDLGVDIDSEQLVYICYGRTVQPGTRRAGIAAAAAATEEANATAAALVPEAAAAVIPEAAAAVIPEAAAAVIPEATGATAPPLVPEMAAATNDSFATNPYSPLQSIGARRHHHHHHHHHRRHLLQAAPVEFGNPWFPETPDRLLTAAEALKLHSRPGSPFRMVLDFDGHVAEGTWWNSASFPKITTLPYDTDGNTASWSAKELNDILAIWRGVSEDYSPWDIDITTEEPAAGFPTSNYTRVSIGNSVEQWQSSFPAGIAYLNAFGKTAGQPAYVFPAQNSNYARYIWETVSHESGHQFGLGHDGDSSVTYYMGGQWAPIMGYSDYALIAQWSKGEYPGADNKEDDCALITRFVPYVPQVHGTTTANAPAIVGTLNAGGTSMTAKVAGIVRSPTDMEYLYFSATAAGTATLQVLVTPSWVSNTAAAEGRSNLNLVLTLTNSAGAVLVTRSGIGISSFTVNLPAPGAYYTSIRGTGAGSLSTKDGYSSYASRGQYQLVATWPMAAGVVSSPSPSPNPSPSPSPRPSPSPSPIPSPSPSPSPGGIITIHAFTGSRAVTATTVTCTFSFTLINSVTGAAIPSASVGGTWSSTRTATGWPYTVSAVLSSADGVVTFTSTKTLPTATGNGCKFQLGTITKGVFTTSATAIKAATSTW